jgi:hypothetical protein
MIGDPGMQQIFAASLRLPLFWQAMPFFVAAASLKDLHIRFDQAKF